MEPDLGQGARPGRRGAELTERQRTVAALAAGGQCTKQIARQLGITERAVKHHLTNVYRRLGIPSRRQLRMMRNDL
jgi:DNA-binding CsgD family transcriptional regulator